MNNPDLTEELFWGIWAGLLQLKNREKLIEVLKIGLVNGKFHSEKQKALIYYNLLAANLINGDTHSFEKILREYEKFVVTIKPISFEKDFGPDMFEDYLMAKEAENAKLLAGKMYEVWGMLPKL